MIIMSVLNFRTVVKLPWDVIMRLTTNPILACTTALLLGALLQLARAEDVLFDNHMLQ